MGHGAERELMLLHEVSYVADLRLVVCEVRYDAELRLVFLNEVESDSAVRLVWLHSCA